MMTFSSTRNPLSLFRRRPRCGARYCRQPRSITLTQGGMEFELCVMHATVFPLVADEPVGRRSVA